MKRLVFSLTVYMCFLGGVSALTFNKNLYQGARGVEVNSVQEFLISQGFLTGTVTGYFGAQTKIAVQKFQKQNGVSPTGNWLALTRQKAESLALPKTTVIAPFSTSTNTPTQPSLNKTVTLTIDTTVGGHVFSEIDGISGASCYSTEICKKSFPLGKKVILKAIPMEGYMLKSWSEAGCLGKTECSITLQADTTVYARYEVIKRQKFEGEFSLPHPDTCYIALGRQTCDWRMTWNSDAGLNMRIKVDGKEYYLGLKDPNPSYKTSDLDPRDIEKAEKSNTNGPIYFTLGFGSLHKAEILDQGRVMDSISIEVKCAPGTEWNGGMCWQKNARMFYIFKQEGIVVTSEPAGLKCGYEPELCVAGFPEGTLVTLTASSTGRQFLGWTGDCSGDGKTCKVLVDKNKSVGLKF